MTKKQNGPQQFAEMKTENARLKTELAALKTEFDLLWRRHSAVESPANDLLRRVDAYAITTSFLTVEFGRRKPKERELDLIDSGAFELVKLAEELVQPWRSGRLEPLTLP